MSTINSDNFDGRTNGTDINGATVQVGGGTWTCTAAEFLTDNVVARSGANSILFNTNDATVHNCYVSNNDSANGDSRATVACWLNTTGASGIGVVAEARVRWTSQTATGDSTGSCYLTELNAAPAGSANLTLYKNVSGTQTQLGSTVTLASFTAEIWYVLLIQAVGSTVKVQVQRDSDSNYLTSAGAWQSGQAYAFNLTDSSVTGAGGGAFSAYAEGTAGVSIRFDDFLFENLVSAIPNKIVSVNQAVKSASSH